MRWIGGLLVLVAAGAPRAFAEEFQGLWVTDLGRLDLVQEGDALSGTYGRGGELNGTLAGRSARLTWRLGRGAGTAEVEFAPDGLSLQGTWSGAGSGGRFHGWRSDARAERARPGRFEGVWLSSLGTMQLTQRGTRVTGTYGAEGWASVEGEVRGRRLALTWKRLGASGPAWIELTPDGERFFGLTEESPPATWIGVRLSGFARHARAKPGVITEGRADNGMLYFVRVPRPARPGHPLDTIVLLHGSNWTTRGMVQQVVQRFPDLAERYAILGLQGQQWVSVSDPPDLRFNYTYVNWTGRSTYQGFPNTDRESPYLVTQVVDELKEVYGLGRVFVGGHSQGAFLTYLLHLHYPEKWAGTFPMAGGLILQAEPDAFDDEALRQAQRAVPMAIVHGTRDEVVPFATARYAFERLRSHGFGRLALFAPDRGHAFDFLPLDEVMAWLEGLASAEPARLEAFATAQAEAGRWRDVAAALVRADELRLGPRLAAVARRLDAEASREAPRHLAAIRADDGPAWVEPYLAWQDAFEYAPAAREVVAAYRAIQARHDPEARRLVSEAQAAFRSGRAEEGWARYEEVVTRCYASKMYRIVQAWLADRR